MHFWNVYVYIQKTYRYVGIYVYEYTCKYLHGVLVFLDRAQNVEKAFYVWEEKSTQRG